MHPDCEIVHDSQQHPGSNGGCVRAGQLLVQHPLQPPVEVHAVGMVYAECSDRG
jgi:hypothetical protein